jgi:hypothetical protein
MKRKIRKFKGGGMDASKGDFSPGPSGKGRDRDFQQRGMSKADYAKSTTQSGGGNKNVTTTHTKNQFKNDVPFSKPFGYKSQVAASLIGLGPLTAIGNLAAKQNYKSRQKFATKETLARDFYRTTNTALQPNSPIGKDYLKDAGFGKSKAPVSTVGGEGGGDGNNKPIFPIETTKSVDMDLIKPKENFFNFVAYKVGGLSGGVSYGPPPKKGPNPNVPPVKMKKGGYKK